MTRKRRDYSKLHSEKLTKGLSDDKKNYQDERFWVLSRDQQTKAGNAVIRFLPNKKADDLPFKLTYKHALEINGKYLIDKCPTTIGEQCPICDWNKDKDSDFVLGNKTYRQKRWICNILVVSDPKCRENEGKVFLFEFGKQIYDILKETLQPEDEDDKPMYYYCPDNGANFKVKVKKDGQFPTWARSTFLPSSPIDDDYEALNIKDEDWLDNLYDLNDVVTKDSYKNYDDLKVKLNKFLSRVNADGIDEDNELKNIEKEAVSSYKDKKSRASKIMDKNEETEAERKKPEPEPEPKTEPVKKNTTPKDGLKSATAEKVKNYFEDDDDD